MIPPFDDGSGSGGNERWLNGLHRFAIRHPVLVLVIAVLVTAAAAPGIRMLRLRTDGQALVPQQAPAVRFDHEVRREFGVHDPIVILIRPRHADGIFNPRTLHLVADLTADLRNLPGLDRSAVTSLATEASDRFRPGTLQHRGLLEPVPETRDQLDLLRGDLEAFQLYTGTLVSFDGTSTALLVGSPAGADRTALVAAIRGLIARADTTGHEMSVIGAPVAEALLGTHILEDLGLGLGSGGLDRRPEPGLGTLSRLRLAIARHLGLLPLSIVIMALVFLLCFRSLTAALLPLGEAGACLVLVFGAMGWTGVPVYLTMAVLPVILVSMGLADEIHVFSSYRRQRAARPGAPIRDVVREALDEISLPVVASSVTTAAGFLSFAVSPLLPVRAFGIFTAIGILFCMLWTLSVIPALLVLIAPRGLHAPEAKGTGGWGGLAASLGRRPAVTLAVTALGLALCVPGIRRLVVQDSWISGFAPDSDFYRATQYFNQHFFGTHRLLLVLDTGKVDVRGRILADNLMQREILLPPSLKLDPESVVGCSLVVSRPVAPGPPMAPQGQFYRPSSWGSIVESATRRDGRIAVTTRMAHGAAVFLLAPSPGETLEVALHSHRLALPGVLHQVEDLERFVRRQARYTVGGVLGPPDQIATAEFITNYRDPEWRRIPSDPEEVRWLWDGIAHVQGKGRLRELVDPDLRRGLITVFMRNANYIDTARLMDSIRAYERTRLRPERIRLDFAGDVAVSQTLIEAIVRSQVGSLIGSLLGILAVTALLFRSLRWGTICMLPAGIGVAVTFAVMGWTGIPVGVATSMFAAMVLGVGVDFAIHLVERFRASVAGGVTREGAILDALAVTGPAIVANAMAVALGFGILVLSRVPANARLGALTVVSLLACLAATLVVVPALLRLVGGGRRSPGPGD